MSLTKAQLFEKAAPRIELIKDVPGFGDVWIRSCPQLEYSHRWVTYGDPMTGTLIPEERAKAAIHELIDQVMVDQETLMFTEDDFDQLAALDSEKLGPLIQAVNKFNAGDEKKVPDESKGTSTS